MDLVDLLFVSLAFNGFSKQSDLNKALCLFYGIWFSSSAANYIKDEYNSDKENERKTYKKLSMVLYVYTFMCHNSNILRF